ncbi:Pol polyprotein [Elysia marginata]|uniref:Pol polyprotein n=1 Tax=Elysia marginata TaxID=1093978 RepID=A0AAV4FMS5_9GAST|nr:Pol polyprotein [Elysia marginata]
MLFAAKFDLLSALNFHFLYQEDCCERFVCCGVACKLDKDEGVIQISTQLRVFRVNKKDYLVLVEYYFKYPKIAILRGKEASSVVALVKIIFPRQGIPEELIADKDLSGSKEMRQFAEERNFTITTSRPIIHNTVDKLNTL